MVPIAPHATMFACIEAHRHRQRLCMSAVVAGLRGVGRRHFDHCSLSLFHFREQCYEKGTPCRICYRCVESCLTACSIRQILSSCLILLGLGAFDHVTDHQGFYRDQPETIDDASGLLLNKVLSPPSDPLMNPRHHLAPFCTLFGAFLYPRELAGGFGKVLLFFAEKAGILNLLPSGEVGKGL